MKLLTFLWCLMPMTLGAQQPNIIYIMSDDHDADAISAYNKKLIHTPNIDRLAREGMLFTRAFVANSICGPARATLLTGQHSHKNGMRDNRTRFDSTKLTIAGLMSQNGYQTAIVGKWHLHSYPTGFDYWNILPGQGLYFEPRFISMSGDTSTLHGYATDVITDEAIRWLDNRDKSKPFILLLHHKAPHRPFTPPLKYLEQFHSKKIPEPPTLYNDSFGHGTAWRLQTLSIYNNMNLGSDLKIDPVYLDDIPELKPDAAEVNYYHSLLNRVRQPDLTRMKEIYAERGKLIQKMKPKGKELLKYKYQWYMQDYLACVASIDENIGRTLDYLDRNGLTKNTIVIYTSDQGFYLGENGWFDKRWMYDVSMQVPLLVRWPGYIKPGSVNTSIVQNIDYAPTFLELSKTTIPGWMQGESLVPALSGRQKYGRDLYYHFYEYYADHSVLQHLGIRGERYKLIYFYTVNEWELYDLKADPQEQVNLAKKPSYQTVMKKLKAGLIHLRDKYDDHEPAGELH